MQVAEAATLDRKSGKPTCPGLPWSDLQFRGSLLEMRNALHGRLLFEDLRHELHLNLVQLLHCRLQSLPVFKRSFAKDVR